MLSPTWKVSRNLILVVHVGGVRLLRLV